MAIGDIHTESYPYSSLTDSKLAVGYGRNLYASGAIPNSPTRPLDIVSLGRLIGPASNLNPHMLGPNSITESVPMGVHQFSLTYTVETPASTIFSDTTVFINRKTTVEDLLVAGDYYIDAYGRVFSVTAMSGGTVTYDLDPVMRGGGQTYQDSTFNVIPDVNQLEAGSGCSVGALDGDGRRAITLPTVTHHHYDTAGIFNVLTATDPTFGLQLTLPKVLVDSWSLEEEIPGGFLYLKNYTKNKIYKAATYYYYSSSSILIGGEDITEDVDAGDIFCIITVGTDITTSIDDLRRKSHHSHDRRFGEPLVSVASLADVFAVAGNSGVFAPSAIPGNYFPQYLHRDGYTTNVDANVNDENIMRGDLVLGVEGAVAGGHNTDTGASFKLRFWGDGLFNNPYIYRDGFEGFIINGAQTYVSGDYFDDCMDEGVRIRDAYLVPEKGMLSGLNDPVGVSNGEYPVKTMALVLTGTQDLVTGSWDLGAYGLNSTDHEYLNIQVTLRVDLNGDVWPPGPACGSGFDWDFMFSPPLGSVPWTLTIYYTGASWTEAGAAVTIFATVFFAEKV